SVPDDKIPTLKLKLFILKLKVFFHVASFSNRTVCRRGGSVRGGNHFNSEARGSKTGIVRQFRRTRHRIGWAYDARSEDLATDQRLAGDRTAGDSSVQLVER